MTLYLDTLALAKLLAKEPENRQPFARWSSATTGSSPAGLAELELMRLP